MLLAIILAAASISLLTSAGVIHRCPAAEREREREQHELFGVVLDFIGLYGDDPAAGVRKEASIYSTCGSIQMLEDSAVRRCRLEALCALEPRGTAPVLRRRTHSSNGGVL